MTEPKAPTHSRPSALAIFLSVSSAVTIVLALLGYGVALSTESGFGVPHAIIFNSTSDLLTLGGWAVIQMMSNVGKLLQLSFYKQFWSALLPMAKGALFTAVMAFLLGLTVLGVKHLAKGWRWPSARRAQLRALLAKRGRLVMLVTVPLISLLAFLAGVPLALFAMLFALALLGSVLGFIPSVGLLAGTAHIDAWVIGPEVCKPLRSRDVRMKEERVKRGDTAEKVRAASCVAVKKSDGKEYRGRVVFATFNAVVLYDPTAGTVQRVSTEGASVEVIEKL